MFDTTFWTLVCGPSSEYGWLFSAGLTFMRFEIAGHFWKKKYEYNFNEMVSTKIGL